MPARPGVLQGFELVDNPGECCKKCQQTQCIVINRPGSQGMVLKVRTPVLPRLGQGCVSPGAARLYTSCLLSGHLPWDFGPLSLPHAPGNPGWSHLEIFNSAPSERHPFQIRSPLRDVRFRLWTRLWTTGW